MLTSWFILPCKQIWIVRAFGCRSTNERPPETYLLFRLSHHRCLIFCYSSKLFVKASYNIGQEIIIGVLFYGDHEKPMALKPGNNLKEEIEIEIIGYF